MITRKNIFHYLIYVIFALVFFCSIGLYSVSMTHEGNPLLFPLFIRYLVTYSVAVLLIVLYRFIYNHIPAKFVPSKMPVFSKGIEALGIFLVVFAMIFVRIIAVSGVKSDEINNVFLNYALFKSETLPNSAYITFVYGRICRLFCKINASVYPLYALNSILQIGTCIFTYYALKIAFRIRYAIPAFLILALSPVSINHILYINSDTLLAFFISMYMFLLVYINDQNRNMKLNENYKIVYFVGIGILAAYVCLLDILPFVLVIITFLSFLMIYRKETKTFYQTRWFQILVYFLSFTFFFILFSFLLNNNGIKGFDNIRNYIDSFYPLGLTLNFYVPMEGRFEGIIVYILTVPFILSFLKKNMDKGLFVALIAITAAIFTFVNFNSTDYKYVVDFVWAIIASIGIFAIPQITASEEELEEEEIAEIKRIEAKVIEREERSRKKKAEKEYIKLEKDRAYNEKRHEREKEFEEIQTKREEKHREKVLEKYEEDSLEYASLFDNEGENGGIDMFGRNASEIDLTTVNESKKQNDNFIKNPLPGPKPHVSKELSYDYDLKPSEMDFDLKDLQGKDYYDI